MRNRALVVTSVLVLAGASVVFAQDQGVQAVIGNVFLQNTTPGNPQIGHAAIKGTFRAGQVFVQQGTGTTTPVVGNNTATGDGFSNGGSFSSAQERGTGVRGTGTALTGITTGVYGETRSTDGRGVVGNGKGGGLGVFGLGKYGVYGNGTLNGVVGQVSGAGGSGVDAVSINVASPAFLARNLANGIGAKILGNSEVTGEFCTRDSAGGVLFISRSFGNLSRTEFKKSGSKGSARLDAGGDESNFTLFSQLNPQVFMRANVNGVGSITADVKNFVQPDPDNEERDIYYASVEGPEAAAYVRGTAKLVNGVARVALPRHFQNVSVAEGMTIQLTPKSADSEGLAVTSESLQSFEVRELRKGRGSYEFNWEVKAVRRGFTDYKVYRSWEDRGFADVNRSIAMAARKAKANSAYGIQYRNSGP